MRSPSRSRGSRSRTSRRDATILSPQTRAGRRTCTSSSAARRRPIADHARRSRAHARSGRVLLPSARCRRAARRRKRFHAVEDTFCYLLPRDDFLELRRHARRSSSASARRRITETLKQSLAQLATPTTASAPRSSRRLAARSASSCGAPPVACTTDNADRATRCARMRDGQACARSSCTDAGGAPVGMFTLVDLLAASCCAERPLTTPMPRSCRRRS